ncbi:hypothetical protein KIW84_076899 [Lathyrus oleraceus]|uniref:Protein FAR1-RELATED SEQUENCE n=1 Tax=Pisum sativum TaxID=3888 RepID=A0A9D5A2Y7_PEA|nr:hypothetical protein KIW84_076899 [Pisum sativum]
MHVATRKERRLSKQEIQSRFYELYVPWKKKLQKFIQENVKFSIEVSTYKVREIYKEKPIYHVNFHVTSKEANCSCHMFEFSSIICRHVLCVFIKKKLYCLPSQYVLHRWSINAKKEKEKEVAIEGFQEGSSNASDTSLFNSIMVHSLKLSERGSQSKKHHDIAIQSLQNGIAKLDLLDIEESIKKFVDSTSEDMPKVSDVSIALHDPSLIATKGRPWTLQMKSSLEMVKKD